MRESESEFQGWIIDTAKAHGWRVWHVPTPMRPIGNSKFVPDPRGRGLPDLIMLHEDPPRLMFIEAKAQDGRVSVEQAEFLRIARAIQETLRDQRDGELPPLRVLLARPSHRDLIEAALQQ